MKDLKIRYLTDNTNQEKKVSSFLEEWNSNESLIKINTSGSTGQPKEMQIEKSKMLSSAKATIDFLELKSGFTSLLCISTDNVGGKMMLVRSLLSGKELLVSPVNSNPIEYLNEKVDFCAMVPMQVETALDQNPEKFKWIDKLIIGGAPISRTLEKRIHSLPCNCFHTFGMTETVSHIALRSITAGDKHFTAIGLTTFSEINNQLVIHAPELEIDSLATNDVIELINPTKFIWKGRADFVINSGGIKLHPEMIENELSQIIRNNFFVFGVNDDKLGEHLEMIVEGEIDVTLTDRIKDQSASKYSIPKTIHFLGKFIYTSSGKINRLLTIKLLSE